MSVAGVLATPVRGRTVIARGSGCARTDAVATDRGTRSSRCRRPRISETRSGRRRPSCSGPSRYFIASFVGLSAGTPGFVGSDAAADSARALRASERLTLASALCVESTTWGDGASPSSARPPNQDMLREFDYDEGRGSARGAHDRPDGRREEQWRAGPACLPSARGRVQCVPRALAARLAILRALRGAPGYGVPGMRSRATARGYEPLRALRADIAGANRSLRGRLVDSRRSPTCTHHCAIVS